MAGEKNTRSRNIPHEVILSHIQCYFLNKLNNKREFVYIKFYYLKMKIVKLDYGKQ